MAITNAQKNLLNRMNRTAAAAQLGTVIQNSEATVVSEVSLAENLILVGQGDGTADAVAMSGDATIAATGAVTIAAGAIDKAMLSAGILPSHIVVYAGKFTTVGGDAAEAISVPGVVAGDVALVTVQTLGTGSRTITAAIPATDAINVTMSGDPSNDHILSYMVLRATT